MLKWISTVSAAVEEHDQDGTERTGTSQGVHLVVCVIEVIRDVQTN